MNDLADAGPRTEAYVAADGCAIPPPGAPAAGRSARLACVLRAVTSGKEAPAPRASVAEGARSSPTGWLMFDTGAGALALAADIVDGAAVDWPKDDAPANLAELLCVLSALEPLLRDIEDMTAWRLDPQGFAPAAAGAQARLQLRNPSGELLHDLWFAVEDALIDALPLSPEMEMLGGMVAVSLWLEGPLAPLGELGRLGPGDVVPVEAEAVIGVLEGPGGRRLPGVLAARGWRFAAQPFEPYGPSVAPGSAAVRLAIRAGPVLIERARWAGIAAGEAMRLPAEVARSAILLNGADILAEGRLSAIGGLFGFFVDRLGPGK